ncbi:two-component system, response regulator YesN [Pseudobutyrivibrio sp. YE44]|uniref:response regulator n=1 Tax=Pseudobutyrivibrio sp. YE44 TaxID=1520802 RepID=UPI000890011E|nr:response regulator [Pseudobutyrivibrio sp. YE44]SDB22975.1 two-component system, response regulator YesN [Pseudobutyrivibrio sp. YE44]
MYKIMLADDEGIVIDSLKFIIEKEYGSQCDIRVAKTGRQVIELAEEFQPDIAFMDIQMPGINGIEAMREIRRTNNHVVFIVMTAYDKFDYAKEAISLGVLDYLNKPVSRDAILSILKKAMGRIDGERTKRSDDLRVREKLEIVVPIIENGLIQDLLFKEYFKEDIDNYKTLLGIDCEYGYMACMVFGRELVGNYMKGAVAASIQAQKSYKEIHTITDDYIKGIMGNVMSNKIPILIPCEKDTLSYNERNDIVENARALCRKLADRFDMDFRVGFGSVKPLERMSESYEEANSVLISNTNHVAHVDDMPVACQYESNYPMDMEKRLFDEITLGNISESISIAQGFFEWMEENYGTDHDSVRLKCLEFVLWAEHLAYEKTGRMYEFKSRANYLSELMSFTGLGEVKVWFIEKIKATAFWVSNKHEEQSMSAVNKAKQYIDENYMKELTLDDVSRVVNISSYYFSKVFKEETGENFIDYLTKLRIEAAKKLLKTTNKSMKEISAEVGYSDPNYFSRNFKKYTGKTPTDYARCN